MDATVIRFRCPACSRRRKAPARAAGRFARCSCGQRLQVPGEPPGAELVPVEVVGDEPLVAAEVVETAPFEPADTSPAAPMPAAPTADRYQVWLRHLVNTLTRDGYICLTAGGQLSAEQVDQIEGQAHAAEDQLGKVFDFFLGQGLKDLDLGLFDFLKKNLLAIGAERAPAQRALARLTAYLGHVDLIALKVGKFGAKFLAVVNGERCGRESVAAVDAAVNGLADAVRDLIGAWKLRVAGLRIGKGVGLDVLGTAVFAFDTPGKLERMRPAVTGFQFGYTAGQHIWAAVRMVLLNVLLFGHRGRIYGSKLIVRLFDDTTEVPGFWRSVTSRWRWLDRLYFGLPASDLIPPGGVAHLPPAPPAAPLPATPAEPSTASADEPAAAESGPGGKLVTSGAKRDPAVGGWIGGIIGFILAGLALDGEPGNDTTFLTLIVVTAIGAWIGYSVCSPKEKGA